MAEATLLSPHLSDTTSPLSAMIDSSLRRFGAFPSAKVDGQTAMMFIEFANEIIDECRMHPYWTLGNIKYYTHHEEKRAIPDPILRSGLLYKYAIQQDSTKQQTLGPLYYQTMNRELWRLKAGGYTRIQMRVVDDGSNPNAAGARVIDPVNGAATDQPE